MFTLGYRFRPWTDPKAIADGPSILRYIHDTADASSTSNELIRLNHRVVHAIGTATSAAGPSRCIARTPTSSSRFSCAFLYVCTGYYRYDEGFSPEFPGVERFRGPGRSIRSTGRRTSTTATSASS